MNKDAERLAALLATAVREAREEAARVVESTISQSESEMGPGFNINQCCGAILFKAAARLRSLKEGPR